MALLRVPGRPVLARDEPLWCDLRVEGAAVIRRMWWSKRSLFLGVLLCAAVVGPAVSPGAAAAASPCTPPVVNPVACENTKAGDPPETGRSAATATPRSRASPRSSASTSARPSHFKINTPSSIPHRHPPARLLRGRRRPPHRFRDQADGHAPADPARLPDDRRHGTDRLRQLGVSASWTVPTTAVSGVYIAHLVRDDATDTGGDSQILFVVRNDASHSDILYTRPPTRPGRRTTTTAATASTSTVPARRVIPATRAPTRSPTTAPSTPPSRPTTAVRTVLRRVPDDPVPGENGYDVYLHERL